MAVTGVGATTAVQRREGTVARPPAAKVAADRPAMPLDSLMRTWTRVPRTLRQGLLGTLVAAPAAAVGADSILGGATRASKQLTILAAVGATAAGMFAARCVANQGRDHVEQLVAGTTAGAITGAVAGLVAKQMTRGIVTGIAGGTIAVLASGMLYNH